MRTTLDIADDVLAAARERAASERKTIGEVISSLVRQALSPPPTPGVQEPPEIYGFRPFPSRGGIVTNELINRLREDDVC